MPFLDRGSRGRLAIFADAERAEPKLVPRVAIEMDLNIERRDHMAALASDAFADDRQAESVALEH